MTTQNKWLLRSKKWNCLKYLRETIADFKKTEFIGVDDFMVECWSEGAYYCGEVIEEESKSLNDFIIRLLDFLHKHDPLKVAMKGKLLREDD